MPFVVLINFPVFADAVQNSVFFDEALKYVSLKSDSDIENLRKKIDENKLTESETLTIVEALIKNNMQIRRKKEALKMIVESGIDFEKEYIENCNNKWYNCETTTLRNMLKKNVPSDLMEEINDYIAVRFFFNSIKYNEIEIVTEQSSQKIFFESKFKGIKPILYACINDRFSIAEVLASVVGIDIHAFTEEGNTVFHIAVMKNQVDFLKKIIKKKTEKIDFLKLRNKDGDTALLLSLYAQPNNQEIVKIIINSDSSTKHLEIENKFGRKPIQVAFDRNLEYAIELLIDKNVDIEDDMLLRAIEKKFNRVASLLAQSRGSGHINYISAQNKTPALLAIEDKNDALAYTIIFERHAIIPAEQENVLHLAIDYELSMTAVALADKRGNHINFKEKDKSPLYKAIVKKKSELALRLIRNGAVIGDGMLGLSIENELQDVSLELCKHSGRHINYPDQKGNPPLYRAIVSSNADLALRLIRNKAVISDNMLNLTIINKLEDVSLELSKHPGAHINYQNQDGNTPLHLIAENQKDFKDEIISNLIEAGAIISIKKQKRGNSNRYK